MSDLIDRQKAIDAVHYYIESGYKCDIFQELKDLPSTEPERKKGEWIRKQPVAVGEPWFICSKCHVQSRNPYNFCPNCGADMKGGK